MHGHGKAVDFLLEQRSHGFGRDVAAGEAGAAGGQHRVDLGVGGPAPDCRLDLGDLVPDDGAVGKLMARLRDQPGEQRAGFVIGQRARIRHRQHGDADGFERPVFV